MLFLIQPHPRLCTFNKRLHLCYRNHAILLEAENNDVFFKKSFFFIVFIVQISNFKIQFTRMNPKHFFRLKQSNISDRPPEKISEYQTLVLNDWLFGNASPFSGVERAYNFHCSIEKISKWKT